MAAHPKLSQVGAVTQQPSSRSRRSTNDKRQTSNGTSSSEKHVAIREHLPPLPLVMVVLMCSGTLLVFAWRDFVSTGRNIAGSWDEAMLLFSKSTDWFDESKGWKSTQGGFSAIEQATTDKNNMGGFFVRKWAGAAVAGVHLQKIIPMLAHPTGAYWIRGHFIPLLTTAVLGNVGIIAFYLMYWTDLVSAGATALPRLFTVLLSVETLVMLGYLCFSKTNARGPAVALPEGKSPSSLASNIAARTILIVSAMLVIIAGRDLWFPGTILEFLPRDDMYLEWTNALIHSPPAGSLEYAHHSMEAPLFVGDKFVSQLAALHVLILCLYKFATATMIRYGSDGRGLVQAEMIWKVQAIANALLLFVLRVFTSAAKSASLDLRWHLMALTYETIILGICGYY